MIRAGPCGTVISKQDCVWSPPQTHMHAFRHRHGCLEYSALQNTLQKCPSLNLGQGCKCSVSRFPSRTGRFPNSVPAAQREYTPGPVKHKILSLLNKLLFHLLPLCCLRSFSSISMIGTHGKRGKSIDSKKKQGPGSNESCLKILMLTSPAALPWNDMQDNIMRDGCYFRD